MTDIAFAGDWHGNTGWATEMIRSVSLRGVATIIHTGDYGFTFSPAYVDAVEAALADGRMRLLFVDGNHDDHGLLDALDRDEEGLAILSEHQRHIPRGHRFVIGETTFLGLGGAVSVDRYMRTKGRFWWPTELITYEQLQKAEAGGPVDVMVTHDCPLGVDIPGLQPFGWPQDLLIESAANRHTVRRVVDKVQPRWLIHGHYHRAYQADLHGTHVIGLNCDGSSWAENIRIVGFRKEAA